MHAAADEEERVIMTTLLDPTMSTLLVRRVKQRCCRVLLDDYFSGKCDTHLLLRLWIIRMAASWK
jgi:hypothetical protein